MILQRLRELAESDRMDSILPPSAYTIHTPTQLIKIRRDGSFINIENIGYKDEKGRIKAKEHFVPNPGNRNNPVAGLIADTGEYMLEKASASKEKKNTTDAKREKYANDLSTKHQLYIENLQKCMDSMETEEDADILKAIKTFIDTVTIDDPRFVDVDGDEWITFDVGGKNPVKIEAVKQHWAKHDKDERKGSCLLCGEQKPLVRRHTVKLKGVPNGQSSGTQLISADKNAFYSYGLDESYIAPMCHSCAEKTHHTMNYLIHSDEHHVRIGSEVIYLFWTKEAPTFNYSNLLKESKEQAVKELLKSPFHGKGGADVLNEDGFYALALGGSGGRAVVKDWIDTTLAEAQRNLINYFNRHHITGKFPYHSIFRLAAGTVRELKDVKPWVPVSLFKHALQGVPLPVSLLTTTLRRCAIEMHIKDSQAALIKLYIMSSRIKNGSNLTEDWMVQLDQNCNESAYLYGRLFYALERAQEEATKTTGIERTFGTAMNLPMSTLPRLIERAKQAHLPKIKRDKKGVYKYLDRLIMEILDKLNPLAWKRKRLEPEEQGLFVLGYYHQRAERYRKKNDPQPSQTEMNLNQEENDNA